MSAEFSDLDFIAEGLAPERPQRPDGGDAASSVVPAAAAEARRKASVPGRRRKALSPDADRTAGSRRGAGEALVQSSVPRRLYMSQACYEDIVRLHLLYRLHRCGR